MNHILSKWLRGSPGSLARRSEKAAGAADGMHRFEAEVQKGIDAADRGELENASDVFSRLRGKHKLPAADHKRG